MKRMVGVGLAALLLVIGGTIAVRQTGEAAAEGPPKVQADDMATDCTKAAQEQLQPRITEPGSDVSFELISGAGDGKEWKVQTSVNHKTKWSDNWFDVTCVVTWKSAYTDVKSVETAERTAR